MQYAKEDHDTRERYMKEEHDAKMRILNDADRDGEIEKKKGAEGRDEMEVDGAKQTFEVREQDDERDGAPDRKRRKPNAKNSEWAVKKRGGRFSDGWREYATLNCIGLNGKKRMYKVA